MEEASKPPQGRPHAPGSPPKPEPAPTLAPENPELVVRDAVLGALETTRAALLPKLREALVRLYDARLRAQGRDLAYVSADDARAILEADPAVPPPSQLSRNFLGQLFLVPGWIATGQCIRSRTAGSHGNRILCWRWDPQKAHEAGSPPATKAGQ